LYNSGDYSDFRRKGKREAEEKYIMRSPQLAFLAR
jgi:hypothetical protein